MRDESRATGIARHELDVPPPTRRSGVARGHGAARPLPRLRRAPDPATPISESRMITEAEFRALAAQGYNRIPLVLESFADLDTPLSLYLKLASSATRSCSNRSSAASASAATRSSGCRRKVRHSRRAARASRSRTGGGVVERHDGDPLAFVARIPARASAPRRSPGCRASAAGSPAISATTPCATSSRGSPAARRPTAAGARRRARHPAAADRRARRRRQPRRARSTLIVYADPARARCVRDGAASGCSSCAASCASR